MPDIHQIAWLAGLFDGEAFIGLTLLKSGKTENEGRYWSPRIRLHMTHEATVRRVAELLGGNVTVDKKQNGCNQSWGWDCPRKLQLDLLRSIKPYSVTKQEAVSLMIEFLDYRDRTTISQRRNNEYEELLAQTIRELTSSTRQLRERKRADSIARTA